MTYEEWKSIKGIKGEETPDEYFKPVELQRAAVYYFPSGLH